MAWVKLSFALLLAPLALTTLAIGVAIWLEQRGRRIVAAIVGLMPLIVIVVHAGWLASK